MRRIVIELLDKNVCLQSDRGERNIELFAESSIAVSCSLLITEVDGFGKVAFGIFPLCTIVTIELQLFKTSKISDNSVSLGRLAEQSW